MENIKLGDDAVATLARAARWARTYAMTMLVLLALSALGLGATWAMMAAKTGVKVAMWFVSADNKLMLTVTMASLIVMIVANALPMIPLLCFSGKMQKAARDGDVLTMEHAFRSLKTYFIDSCIVLFFSLIIGFVLSFVSMAIL